MSERERVAVEQEAALAGQRRTLADEQAGGDPDRGGVAGGRGGKARAGLTAAALGTGRRGAAPGRCRPAPRSEGRTMQSLEDRVETLERTIALARVRDLGRPAADRRLGRGPEYGPGRP